MRKSLASRVFIVAIVHRDDRYREELQQKGAGQAGYNASAGELDDRWLRGMLG